MFIDMFINIKKLLFLSLCFISINVSAAILEKDAFENAELSELQNETVLFNSIGLGIALSLAQCEGVDSCSLTVDETELRQLITTLEDRINNLILKQEEAQDPVAFDKVLTAYVSERESYESHLNKLLNITGSTSDESDLLEDSFELESEVSDFPVDSAQNAELLDYLNEIQELEAFEDEELVDDEDLGDLPDLPELE